jgi:hypothetical protein
MKKPGNRKPDGRPDNYKRHHIGKGIINRLGILLLLCEIQKGINHPKQYSRKSNNQENTVKVISPDLCLYADVSH